MTELTFAEMLERDGLSLEELKTLSFQSNLGISLKKNLHYFDQSQLLEELDEVRRWYLMQPQLSDLPIDYRIKSQQSIELKFSRYYPDYQVRKVFNDILGFRSLVDSYKPLWILRFPIQFELPIRAWEKPMMTAIVACMCIINGPDFAILSRFNTILSTIGSSIIGSINIHTSAFWTCGLGLD